MPRPVLSCISGQAESPMCMPRAIMLAMVLALAAVLPSGSAWAHALLVSSMPAANAGVAGPSVAIALHYNSRVDAQRSRLTLEGGAAPQTLKIAPGDSAADLASRAEGLAPGKYTLRWEVLSVDGHISRGTVPFTVTAP